MMRSLLVVMLALACVPAFAQVTIPAPEGPPAFELLSQITIADVTDGQDFDLRGIEADPTRPGKEVLIYIPAAWAFTVGRWHPMKHGIGGRLAGPGLCIEAWTPIQQAGPTWHYNTDADFTGDGIDDFVIYRQDGTVDLYVGRGLVLCR